MNTQVFGKYKALHFTNTPAQEVTIRLSMSKADYASLCPLFRVRDQDRCR